jgi:hypothetical protein
MPAGGVAMATWIRQAIGDTLSPDPALIVPTRQSIRGHVGIRVDRLLDASGGTAPLRWRTTGRSLRHARLHLLANGKLVGTPAHSGTFTLPIEVTDARGSSAHLTVVLTVGSTRQIASR